MSDSSQAELFLDGKVALWLGDCLDVLANLDANSIDACVTDPPYGLGFMGKHWDHGVPGLKYWKQVFRALKPGAHLLAFGGTRTYHRMACAIEDAGFEIRDCIQWLYGSGFPKSHDVSKGIDRAAGAERESIGVKKNNNKGDSGGQTYAAFGEYQQSKFSEVTAPATASARQWEGWGTALKPACEPIVLARKPLSESTVAANVLKWGTGAINVGACRVGFSNSADAEESKGKNRHADFDSGPRDNAVYGADNRPRGANGNYDPPGRWPANVMHDGSEEVVGAFPQTSSGGAPTAGDRTSETDWGVFAARSLTNHGANDGSAARFFYTARPDEPSADRRYTNEGVTDFAALPGARRDAVAPSRLFYTSKADSDDRLGSKHPTVKPLDLMQYLVRLITPLKGLVLDPFAGTGTTGEAAFREGMSAALIERESEYQDDIRRRIKLCLSGVDERAREGIKQRMKDKPADHGPLFAGGSA